MLVDIVAFALGVVTCGLGVLYALVIAAFSKP